LRQELYLRVLRKAATSLGGHDALAVFLGVARSSLETWLNGSAPIPMDAFLACVDHLVDWDFAYVRDQHLGDTRDWH
jgi:hypothetical protein